MSYAIATTIDGLAQVQFFQRAFGHKKIADAMVFSPLKVERLQSAPGIRYVKWQLAELALSRNIRNIPVGIYFLIAPGGIVDDCSHSFRYYCRDRVMAGDSRWMPNPPERFAEPLTPDWMRHQALPLYRTIWADYRNAIGEPNPTQEEAEDWWRRIVSESMVIPGKGLERHVRKRSIYPLNKHHSKAVPIP